MPCRAAERGVGAGGGGAPFRTGRRLFVAATTTAQRGRAQSDQNNQDDAHDDNSVGGNPAILEPEFRRTGGFASPPLGGFAVN